MGAAGLVVIRKSGMVRAGLGGLDGRAQAVAFKRVQLLTKVPLMALLCHLKMYRKRRLTKRMLRSRGLTQCLARQYFPWSRFFSPECVEATGTLWRWGSGGYSFHHLN